MIAIRTMLASVGTFAFALSSPASPQATYLYDDGAPEQAIGLVGGGDIAWLQHFDPVQGTDTLFEIATMNGRVGSVNGVGIGTVGTVAIWDDPNGDGDPSDASLLASAPWTVQFKNTGLFEPVAISPTLVNSRFFIGAWVPTVNGMFPAPLDNGSLSLGRSFVAGDSATFDPVCLTCNTLPPTLLGSGTTFDGVWCLRARGTGDAPSSFCTAKAGLSCGTPAISAHGLPSATLASGFVISAAPAATCRVGVLLYAMQRLAPGMPFQGGTLCLPLAGLRRAGPVDSRGTPGPTACNGRFAIDLNTFARGVWAPTDCAGVPTGAPPHNPAAFLGVVGQEVFCQFWGRDTLTAGTFVSDGVRFTIGL